MLLLNRSRNVLCHKNRSMRPFPPTPFCVLYYIKINSVYVTYRALNILFVRCIILDE